MISVVMPLHNEGGHIAGNLKRTVAALEPVGAFEIIVVDDGSADNSRQEIERIAAESPAIRTLCLEHRGKGEALRRGALAARGEYVIFLDADLDIPPEQVMFFVALCQSHQADAVIGSKLHPDSTVDYPWRRRLYSRGYALITRLLFGLPVRDTQTGLKLVRRDLLIRALEQTRQTGFTLDLELLVHLVRLGARMIEAPVVVHYRFKFGGIGWRTACGILIETLQIWRRLRK